MRTLSFPKQSVSILETRQPVLLTSYRLGLPVFFDDNYISLLPGEKREITVHVRKSDIGAAKPVLVVDGFNVAGIQQP